MLSTRRTWVLEGIPVVSPTLKGITPTHPSLACDSMPKPNKSYTNSSEKGEKERLQREKKKKKPSFAHSLPLTSISHLEFSRHQNQKEIKKPSDLRFLLSLSLPLLPVSLAAIHLRLKTSMRIRKSASKLLGSANAYASPPLRSASSESWDSQASAAAGLLCELNRSPWDLIPNLHDSSGIIAFQEEEKEQGVDRGIIGNDIKLEEEPIPPNKSEEEMEENGEKDKRKKKKKKKIRRKRKEKEIETGSATAAEATVSCKKSDGKGWHCKRPANLPHSLCLYHLAQLRSYSYSHSKVANPANGGQFSVRKKKGDATGDGRNLYYYYYYAGFGPWRGKRRGDKTGDVVNGSDTAIKEEEEGGREVEEEEEEEEGKEDDAPVAGDDEEGGEDDDDEEEEEEEDSGKDSSDEEKNRNRRKRGRKPVKARSLKSLL